ncbi:hypothetical protein H1C71_017084 [Ictidomys tridecemlineatus]|nr:hypothetical protein H1C71_017084 [Ictidomys tridecemlineatus]
MIPRHTWATNLVPVHIAEWSHAWRRLFGVEDVGGYRGLSLGVDGIILHTLFSHIPEIDEGHLAQPENISRKLQIPNFWLSNLYPVDFSISSVDWNLQADF